MKSDEGGIRVDRRWLLALVALYLAVGIVVAWRCVHQINPDAVSYLRLAQYYAEGDLQHALSSYWYPLLPWLLAPLLRAGLAPLVAARSLLLLAGLGLTLASWLLLGRLGVSGSYRRAGTICMAVVSLSYSVYLITPDLLVAGLLVLYLWLSLDPAILRKPAVAFQCGLLGGLACLAKTYALPFFAVHFLGMVIAHARQQPGAASGRALRSFGLALAGAGIVALPWATALSVKVGHPTLGTAGVLNHALFGPALDRQDPHLRGLAWPKDGRLNEWEDPFDSSRVYPPWSPFADWASFTHQLRIIGSTPRHLVGGRFLLYNLGALSSVLFCVILSRRRAAVRKSSAIWWVVWTVGLYGAGYSVMCGSQARFYWPLAPVLVGLSFLLLQTLGHGSQQPGGRKSTWPAIVLAVILCSSPFVTMARYCIAPRGVAYSDIAQQLSSLSVRSPLAASEWTQGLYVSYYLDMTYLGRPAGDSPQEVAAELAAAGAGTFLVSDDPALAGELKAQPSLRRVATIRLLPQFGPDEVAVFAVAEVSGAEGTSSAGE